jgi:hypothetical protein
MISSMDLFLRRDWADGAGPAVELAKPLLVASPDVAVVAAGAAVDVALGAAVLFVAPVAVVPTAGVVGAAPDEAADVPVAPPEVAVDAAG